MRDKKEAKKISASWQEFLKWEKQSREVVLAKKIYIDIAQDIIAGILLNQIIYWHLPSKYGTTKLRVSKDGKMWLVKRRTDWWDEIRLSPKQYDRAIKILKDLRLLETKLFKFNSVPVVHIHLCENNILKALQEYEDNSENKDGEEKRNFPKRENRNSRKGKIEIPERGKSYNRVLLTDDYKTIPSKDGISASALRSRDFNDDFGYQENIAIDSQNNTRNQNSSLDNQDSIIIDSQNISLDCQQEFDDQKLIDSKPDRLREMAREKSNEKKPEKPDYECPKINLELVEYWLSVTGKYYRKRNTKIYENDCKNIGRLRRGTFFTENNTPSVSKKYYGRKFTNDEIQLTMDRFSIMRNNADFYPKDKTNIKRMSITSFLYNQLAKGYKKSYFITCFENEPQRIKPELKDTNPDLTDLIVRTAKERYDWDLSNGDYEIAIKCSRKLTEFFESNKKNMPLYKIHYLFNNQKVDALFDMLEYNEDYDRKPKPIYLSTDITFAKIFPEYMRYIGSLE